MLFLNLASWNEARFFPSVTTPSCHKFPAVTHDLDVCQKNLPGPDKNESSSEGKQISDQSDRFGTSSQLEVVLYSRPCFLWLFSAFKRRNNKHVRKLVTGYWMFFFFCLFFSASPHLKQPLKVCFLPCNVGSEACTTSCRHTCGHDTTMIILKVHDHLYLCLFNKEYICYMISLKYTAGFLCIYTGVRTLFGDQQLLTWQINLTKLNSNNNTNHQIFYFSWH